MENNKRIVRLRDKISEVEITVDVMQAVAAGYEDIRNAASREMFRRSSEKAPND